MTNFSSPPVIEPHGAAVAALADDAVTAVMDALYASFPGLHERLGQQGRAACRQDLQFHLSFLNGALLSGSEASFRDYSAWVHTVLRSRNVPSSTLRASFEHLIDFFRLRLPAGESGVIVRFLNSGLSALSADSPFSEVEPVVSDPACQLADRLTLGDHVYARAVAAKAEWHGYIDLAVSMFQPALYRVGQLWRDNKISVAQEHLATCLAQTVLTEAFSRARPAIVEGRRVVCACVANNQHSLGLRIVADAFELAGWRSTYLGANVPLKDLVSLVGAGEYDVVALSVACASELQALRDSINLLRGELGQRCPAVLVGGRAINDLPELWRHSRADLWCRDALGIEDLAQRF